MSSHIVYRLIPPRPTFNVDMTEDERAIMIRHAEYWRALPEAGKVVVYGPVLDGTGSWGLGVFEAGSEDGARAIANDDPGISSQMAAAEVGPMLNAFLRQ
jgi:uncharacterized protein